MFRMLGDKVEVLRFKVTYQEEVQSRETGEMETTEQVLYAAYAEERDELLAFYEGAAAEMLATDGEEWLDGLTFDSFEEAEKALAGGIYLPKKSMEQLQADIDYIAIMTGVEL